MKVKVLKDFRDKNTLKIVKKGSTITVTKERFAEIKKVDASFVEEIKDKKAANSEKTAE